MSNFNLVNYTYDNSMTFFESILKDLCLNSNIQYKANTYGQSSNGNDLIDFTFGDIDNSDAKHVWIISNLGGNQHFSNKIAMDQAKSYLKRAKSKTDEHIVYHFVPQPNPDKAIHTQSGVRSLLHENMSENEVQAISVLYFAMEYLANQTKKYIDEEQDNPYDYSRRFCTADKLGRTEILTEMFKLENLSFSNQTQHTVAPILNIYNRLIQYPNQKVIMYNALKGTNLPTDIKSIDELEEIDSASFIDICNYFGINYEYKNGQEDQMTVNFSEEQKIQKEQQFANDALTYFNNIYQKYNLTPSNYTPTSPELSHVNADYFDENGNKSEAKMSEQTLLDEYMTKYKGGTIFIENITGSGRNFYIDSDSNQLSVALARTQKLTDEGFTHELSGQETFIDGKRKDGNCLVITFETSPIGTPLGANIMGSEKCTRISQAIQKIGENSLNRILSFPNLKKLNEFIIKNIGNIKYFDFKNGDSSKSPSTAGVELV